MEALLCKELLEDICHETIGRVMVGQIVSDDDTTLRSVCSSSSNGGKLSDEVEEPDFLADPAHRTKVMVKPVFALVKKTRKQDEVKKVDALRLKKYISCYINQYRNGDFNYFVKNAMAPVEHLFDNHEFCDKSWCWAKELAYKTEEIIRKTRDKQVRNRKNTKLFELNPNINHYTYVFIHLRKHLLWSPFWR